jgi:23S rRNA (adenine2503-C2)-methyltransferase
MMRETDVETAAGVEASEGFAVRSSADAQSPRSLPAGLARDGRGESVPLASLLDLSRDILRDELHALGEPEYRVQQIWHALYGRLASSLEQLTDLPAALRAALNERYSLLPAEPIRDLRSRDGSTVKVLLRLHDGELIEAVLMRYDATRESHRRNTVCVSSQAGCAMACSFCATGQQGFRRNLSVGEIVEQVLYFARRLRLEQDQVTNVVFMGMGEPLANYAATLAAVRTLNDPHGFGLGARHITISTVGIVPAIHRLAREPLQAGLAVSLHAPNDDLRRQLIPTARQQIAAILDACNAYTAATGRRYSVEYALIEGVNDGVELARDLGQLLRGLPCHVNLIPVNPTANPDTRRPRRARVLAFQRELLAAGINCTVRAEKGIDIAAGCGQLRGDAAGAG